MDDLTKMNIDNMKTFDELMNRVHLIDEFKELYKRHGYDYSFIASRISRTSIIEQIKAENKRW
jgi:hypothetical protein